MDSEYYIFTYGLNDNIPIIAWDESSSDFNKNGVVLHKRVSLRIGDPKPSSLYISDILWADMPVVKSEIAREISKITPSNQIQLVDAEISDLAKLGEYTVLHFPNRVLDYDKENSNIEYNARGRVKSVSNIVLDQEFLDSTPLDDRLAFRLKTDFIHFVIHESIKNTIEGVSSDGARFIPLEDWTITSPFGG